MSPPPHDGGTFVVTTRTKGPSRGGDHETLRGNRPALHQQLPDGHRRAPRTGSGSLINEGNRRRSEPENSCRRLPVMAVLSWLPHARKGHPARSTRTPTKCELTGERTDRSIEIHAGEWISAHMASSAMRVQTSEPVRCRACRSASRGRRSWWLRRRSERPLLQRSSADAQRMTPMRPRHRPAPLSQLCPSSRALASRASTAPTARQ
jgi:hypothetical protein